MKTSLILWRQAKRKIQICFKMHKIEVRNYVLVKSIFVYQGLLLFMK